MPAGLLQVRAAPGRRSPLLWVVCGAGRGVGKTHLARKLCQVLPGAVYAKQGTSPPRPGKSESYFRTDEELDAFIEKARSRRHIVAESNALVRRGRGDIIIFLGGEGAGGPASGPAATVEHFSPGGVRPDADWLRSKAHFVLEGGPADTAAWRAALERLRLEAHILEPVLEALWSQAEWKRRAGE